MRQAAEILDKARKYCSYQERYTEQLRQKMRDWHGSENEIEDLIAQLIKEDYLNDERFAVLFARGKFHSRKWGKIKIRIELKQKKIPEQTIEMALREIDEREYLQTLEKLIEQKQEKFKKEKNDYIRNNKVAQSVMRKGFEGDLIWHILKR
jgi:regulatory protein